MFLGNKSLFDLVKDKRRQEFADASSPVYEGEPDSDGAEMPDDPHGFEIGMRRKRRTTMLKKMLADAGYNDLSKMISIKEY